MVIVEKKDGSLRICIDPKELNECVMREYRTIPTAEQISSQLNGKKRFTVIDMADCYWHIKLDEPSSYLCTFNTPFGRYKFNRLPFGLSCASDAAQTMIEKYFGDIEGVLAIHDDLIIAADSYVEHDSILRKVFKKAKENNIKLNLRKIQFRVPEVKYLGNIVSSRGLSPDPAKVKAIHEMPTPTCKQDAQRLLGMVNYLGQFIPNLSEITAPIRALLRQEILWNWNHEQENAFSNLKHILTASPVLAFFDINKPVQLQVDASSHGLGACLTQLGHPISYASRSMNSAETHYAQIEKELLAIVFGCERFNQFVYGRKIHVKSDHKPLESILHKPISRAPPRVQRLLVRLMKYDFDVEFVPGKFLYIADTLSRAHLSDLPGPDDTINDEEILMVHTLVSNLSASPTKISEIQQATICDPTLQMITQYIVNGWPQRLNQVPLEIRPYWAVRSD